MPLAVAVGASSAAGRAFGVRVAAGAVAASVSVSIFAGVAAGVAAVLAVLGDERAVAADRELTGDREVEAEVRGGVEVGVEIPRTCSNRERR